MILLPEDLRTKWSEVTTTGYLKQPAIFNRRLPPTVRNVMMTRVESMTRTWPADWDARKRGVECWFCGNQFGKPFYVGAAGSAHLERHAIARGHSIVIFRNRHVADFTALSTAEVAAYWQDVHSVARMIEQVFAPCHMNFQLLGNTVPHLHVHLVPRYLDDSAPGKPLPWEPKPVAQSEFDKQVQLLTEAARSIPISAPTPDAD